MKLLEYVYHKINYDKLKTNKIYKKSMIPKLKFWYFYNKYDIDMASIFLYKKHRNQIHLFIKFFDDINFPYKNNKEGVLHVKKILFKEHKCKECKKPLYDKPEQIFCSSKCANKFKAKDKKYINKLSDSLSKYHKSLNKEERLKLNMKISNGNKKFYENETDKEKSKRIEKSYEKSKKTFKLKYNHNWCTKVPSIKEKSINSRNKTNMERYGNECFFASKQYLDNKNKWDAQKHLKNFSDINIDFIKNKFLKKGIFYFEECYDYFGFKSKSTLYKIIKNETDIIDIDLGSLKGDGKYKIEEEINKIFNDSFILRTKRAIPPLELDLYNENNKFAIEYNGLMWHSYGKSNYSMFNNHKEENKNKHLNKTILCEEKGIQLYHIFENEWINKDKQDIWISMIKDKQGLNNKIGARKCIIKEVHTKEAKEFINENHMQGYVGASIKIGLYYEDELYSIMTFGKSRYNKNIEYELIRFCTKKGYTIQGGGSKLLKHFEKVYKPKSLLSYANRRWSTGNFYIKSGFVFKEDTVPNYFYFTRKENILWSRNKFQKHKLSSILENFNKEDTETENMYNNGYRKIYDCGNKVFIKEY